MKRLPWKIRIPVALLIGLVPSNFLRIVLHRMINRYHISLSARIGFGTLLAVDDAWIGRATIRHFNRFEGPFALLIEDGVRIGPNNRFTCLLNIGGRGQRLRYCKIGKNAYIHENHFFDTTGGLEIGHSSWIAGCGSQFWTHGPKFGAIIIGNKCYICSAVRFTPGSRIGDKVLVAVGSVVTREFDGNGIMLGGGTGAGYPSWGRY